MSCLVLDLVRWLVVSVPTVLDAQGGFYFFQHEGSAVTTRWAIHSKQQLR